MRFILFVVLFFSFPILAQQVTVTGRCIDKRSKGLENVLIQVKADSNFQVLTNSLGIFEFTIKGNQHIALFFQTNELTQSKEIELTDQKLVRIGDVKFGFVMEEEVKVQGVRSEPFEIPKLKYNDPQKLPLGSVERSLVYMTAATSNNELTTNYNVRGGSYEENLVYVNGFNIYRPFLTRSGQQEGMSFINSALVKSVRFSAGGFDSQYGDKLSSVLDVEYKTPEKLKGSAMASLLGVETHFEHNPTTRFDYLIGARYRSNGYLLNSLPAKGAYNPVFWDAQFLTNYAVTENIKWSVIGHLSSNNYRFAPQSQETDFGTANEAYSFKIYFDGQEQTRFQTMFGGTSLKVKASKKTQLDFYATVFNTNEREYFDIQGQYFINELETDPSQENYGDSIAVLGIGTFLNHARNKLNATIINVYHNGKHILKSGFKRS